jgi:adenylate kinase family enzyme
VQRIVVAGNSGAGKSTLARRVADVIGVPYVEMDSLFHGPGLTRRPTFEADVDAFTAEAAWVTDSIGYADVIDLLWDRADTLVWLDYPRWLCEARVIRRSLARGLLRRRLWNGNRESLWRMATDPEHPVRWGWAHHDSKRRQVLTRQADPRWERLTVIHLPTPGDAERWLRDLASRPS